MYAQTSDCESGDRSSTDDRSSKQLTDHDQIFNQETRRRLKDHRISLLKHKSQNPFTLRLSRIRRDLRVSEFIAEAGYLLVKLKVLHLNCKLMREGEKIGMGGFGRLFRSSQGNHNFAAKRIEILSRRGTQLGDLLTEVCFAKIFSAFKTGPQWNTGSAFDMVVFQNEFYFTMELCKPVVNPNGFAMLCMEQEYRSLYEDLSLMHKLQIVHRDIKPYNLLWSPTFGKLVFCDFGITNYLKEPYPRKSYTVADGTPKYMSMELMSLYEEGRANWVNLYENDEQALDKTIAEISKRIPKQSSIFADLCNDTSTSMMSFIFSSASSTPSEAKSKDQSNESDRFEVFESIEAALMGKPVQDPGKLKDYYSTLSEDDREYVLQRFYSEYDKEHAILQMHRYFCKGEEFEMFRAKFTGSKHQLLNAQNRPADVEFVWKYITKLLVDAELLLPGGKGMRKLTKQSRNYESILSSVSESVHREIVTSSEDSKVRNILNRLNEEVGLEVYEVILKSPYLSVELRGTLFRDLIMCRESDDESPTNQEYFSLIGSLTEGSSRTSFNKFIANPKQPKWRKRIMYLIVSALRFCFERTRYNHMWQKDKIQPCSISLPAKLVDSFIYLLTGSSPSKVTSEDTQRSLKQPPQLAINLVQGKILKGDRSARTDNKDFRMLKHLVEENVWMVDGKDCHFEKAVNRMIHPPDYHPFKSVKNMEEDTVTDNSMECSKDEQPDLPFLIREIIEDITKRNITRGVKQRIQRVQQLLLSQPKPPLEKEFINIDIQICIILLLQRQSRHEEALAKINKIRLKLHYLVFNSDLIAKLYYLKASSQLALNFNDEAINSADCLITFQQRFLKLQEHHLDLGSAKMVMAQAYINKKEYPTALIYLNTCQKIFKDGKIPAKLAVVYFHKQSIARLTKRQLDERVYKKKLNVLTLRYPCIVRQSKTTSTK